MNVISSNEIQERYCLSDLAVRKNAYDCPGSFRTNKTWVFQDTNETKEFFGKIMNIINSATIKKRHGLSDSAVRKNASKCPDSEKIGGRWIFPDTKTTKKFFDKIWIRKRKK